VRKRRITASTNGERKGDEDRGGQTREENGAEGSGREGGSREFKRSTKIGK